MRRTIRSVAMAAALAAACLACAAQAPRHEGKPAVTRTQAEALTPVDLATLAGRHWVLEAWSADEAAPRSPIVTLEYREGRLVGRSGCNRYTAPLVAGSSAAVLKLGAIAATRMMCPEPAMAIEGRFLAALARAKQLGWRGDQLAIVATNAAGVAATMLFAETRSVAQ